MSINYHDGGGNDPFRPDFTSVNVVPADLAEFADLLEGDLAALNDTWALLKDRIGLPEDDHEEVDPSDERLLDPNYPGGPGPSHDAAGIYEGGQFSEAYRRAVFAKRGLMRDLITGLELLRDAARDIHAGYVASDAANADGVEDAFTAYERWRVIDAFRE